MKKALIIGPNIGVSMGRGGGVRVAAKMAEALVENGFIVSLCAFKGYPLDCLDDIHGTSLAKHTDKIRTHYLMTPNDERWGANRLSGVLPIHVGVLPLSLYLQYVIRKFSPNLLIFHDDVPSLIKNRLRRRLTVLYVHFSYATRLKLGVGDIADMTTPSREFLEQLLNPLLRQLVFLHNNPADITIANSSVTASFLKQTWNQTEVTILHPPVDTNRYRPSRTKENLVVSMGTIQPNKRFEDVIRAISMVDSECQLVIIGHYHQGKYYRELLNLIRIKGLRKRVRILPDASRRQVEDTLSRARTIVHASRFEPFGIAVVEGMASGCVPIVYRGATSGPWLDIVKRGEFGIGFETIKELAENIEKIMTDEKVYTKCSMRAKDRSKEFSNQIFRDKFTKIIGCTS